MKLKSKEAEKIVGVEERKMLNKYLAGAVKLMSGKSKFEAKKIAKEYVEKADKSGICLSGIENKKDELKESAARFGLREKVNYATDADLPGCLRDKIPLVAGVAAYAVTVPLMVAASPDNNIPFVLSMAALAYTSYGIAKFGAETLSMSKTKEQQKSVAEYSDIKHAQLTLKLLKKEIEAPEKAAKAEAYKQEVAKYMAMTNPGGMVSPLSFVKKAKDGR